MKYKYDHKKIQDEMKKSYLKPMVVIKWERVMTCLPILIILGLIVVSLVYLIGG